MSWVESVNIVDDNIQLQVGTGHEAVEVVVSPVRQNWEVLTWYSDNPGVVSVNPSSGYMYASGIGTAKIYAIATDGSEQKDYIVVHVSHTVPVEKVTMNPSRLIIRKGDSESLSATISPETATNQNLHWYSHDTSVATVSNGVVTGVSEGITTITAMSADGNGSFGSCKVFITNCTQTVQEYYDHIINTPLIEKTSDGVTYCNWWAQNVLGNCDISWPAGGCTSMLNQFTNGYPEESPLWFNLENIEFQDAQWLANHGIATVAITCDHIAVVTPNNINGAGYEPNAIGEVLVSQSGGNSFYCQTLSWAWGSSRRNEIEFFCYLGAITD